MKLKEWLEKNGIELNPVENFELLKEFRLSKYEIERTKFIEERTAKRLITTDSDLSLHYIACLKNELKVIERWLSDKDEKGQPKLRESTSNQIEILKYEVFVKDEIDKHSPQAQTKESYSELLVRAFLVRLLQDAKIESNESGEKLLKNIAGKYPDYFQNQNIRSLYNKLKTCTLKDRVIHKPEFDLAMKRFNELKSKTL
jgi:hypothetical protein